MALGAQRLVACEKSYFFVTFSPLNAHIFSPSQVESFPINTSVLIHNFSFTTGAVQEEGDSRSFGRSSIISLFFLGIFLSFCILSKMNLYLFLLDNYLI